MMMDKRLKQMENMPIIETTIKRSEDGEWIMHVTTITDIKPAAYYQKIIDSKYHKDIVDAYADKKP